MSAGTLPSLPSGEAVAVADLLRGVDGLPRHEAERLLAVATGRSRAALLAGGRVPAAEAARFRDLCRRRRGGEPLQYLEGSVPFGPVTVRVDSRVLVPRPETERLYEIVTGLLHPAPPAIVVDLCTGSGNLAIALAHDFPAAAVYATELSAKAAALAAENAAANGVAVTVLCGDLFAPLPAALAGSVDAVVANPPYVAAGEVAGLPVDVREHEPRRALVAGERGDEVLARIAAAAGRWLRPGGLLACEIGETQGRRARELFAFFAPDVLPDLTGRDRYVVGRAPGD